MPTRIEFGIGLLERLPEFVAGRSCLLVTTPGGTDRGLTKKVLTLLSSSEVHVWDHAEANPDLGRLQVALDELKGLELDCIVAIGGGSAIDTAKALSVGRLRGFSLRGHLLIGEKLPECGTLPIIAIPTTAGTGSEVTSFATVWDHDSGKKHSLVHPNLTPEIAILDPELTLGLPLEITLATSLDALSQGMESVWNRNATPVSLGFAMSAAKRSFATLPRLIANLDSIPLRSEMMIASNLAGLAISQSRTALAHSISYPITAHYGMPHGLACGFTLPYILAFNWTVDDGRLEEMAKFMGFANVLSLIAGLKSLLSELGTLALVRKYIPDPANLVALAPEMISLGRADNNLRDVNVEDVHALLVMCVEEIYQ